MSKLCANLLIIVIIITENVLRFRIFLYIHQYKIEFMNISEENFVSWQDTYMSVNILRNFLIGKHILSPFSLFHFLNAYVFLIYIKSMLI